MKIEFKVIFNEKDLINLPLLLEDLSLSNYSLEIQQYILKLKKQLYFLKNEVK